MMTSKYQKQVQATTRSFNQNELMPLFKASIDPKPKNVAVALQRARLASTQDCNFSLPSHLYHTNLRGYLLFWLFLIGLLQYDFSLKQDIRLVVNHRVETPFHFDQAKAKQLLTNVLKINNVDDVVKLMLDLRTTVVYALAFTNLMTKNRYGGTYHQIGSSKLMLHADYRGVWSNPKYMDGLTIFLNAIDHIMLPNPLTDVYRSLFKELIAITGTQNDMYSIYSQFFGDALGYVDFLPSVALKNVNKKTLLIKTVNDGKYYLTNSKLMHFKNQHEKLGVPVKRQLEHYNGERIRLDVKILFAKKDIDKLIKQVD